MDFLTELRDSKILTSDEFTAAIEVSNKLLAEKTVEFDLIRSDNVRHIKIASEVIQLFRKAFEFMQLSGNELEKIPAYPVKG